MEITAGVREPAHFDGGITVPILIHGDAAFSGQGIVEETLNLSRLPGYSAGGTIHVIANNQLGFTATPQDSYSTSYASGLARGFKIPIVHVNADDPVACLEAARLAWEYRVRFGLDFLIDLVGYRRYGHNEGDEPSFTQPMMYKAIGSHPTVREQWARTLVDRGSISPELPEALVRKHFDELEGVYAALKPDQEYVDLGIINYHDERHRAKDGALKLEVAMPKCLEETQAGPCGRRWFHVAEAILRVCRTRSASQRCR